MDGWMGRRVPGASLTGRREGEAPAGERAYVYVCACVERFGSFHQSLCLEKGACVYVRLECSMRNVCCDQR